MCVCGVVYDDAELIRGMTFNAIQKAHIKGFIMINVSWTTLKLMKLKKVQQNKS